ncbi:MAG: rhamnogalacturonan acetylesterase [Planctomycetales bacterium]|nr:rhamnogalacturonan acetylesterase [Planctomycetales bacterium]MBN8628300.1 rhamnogalacturonan acetylesterase [Planctomycetota bacterium]
MLRSSFWLASLVAGLSSCSGFAADAPSQPATIVLVGDSTVTDTAGWGGAFAELLRPTAVCKNHAKGGASTKSFYTGNYWKNALAEKPDFVLIQFGHNDMPGKGPHRETDAATTYRDNLKQMIREARKIGARPIIVTSLVRRIYLADGSLQKELAPYAKAARAVAKEEQVPVVDLFARSIELHERMGREATEKFGPPHKKFKGKFDGTHVAGDGAKQIAQLVADELRRVAPDLAKNLKSADAAPVGAK